MHSPSRSQVVEALTEALVANLVELPPEDRIAAVECLIDSLMQGGIEILHGRVIVREGGRVIVRAADA